MNIAKTADIARLIKTRRIALGFTQQDVSEMVGTTRQSIARIERGNGGVSLDVFLKIIAHLGITLEASMHSSTGREVPSSVDNFFGNIPTIDQLAEHRRTNPEKNAIECHQPGGC